MMSKYNYLNIVKSVKITLTISFIFIIAQLLTFPSLAIENKSSPHPPLETDSQQLTTTDIAGTYVITSPTNAFDQAKLIIEKDGSTFLSIKEKPAANFYGKGTTTINGNQVKLSYKKKSLEKGEFFIIILIDLTGITEFDSFQAPMSFISSENRDHNDPKSRKVILTENITMNFQRQTPLENLTIADIAGTYKVTALDFPLPIYLMVIDQEGMTVYEDSPVGMIDCKGTKVKIENQGIITTPMACSHNRKNYNTKFVQEIHLVGITEFDSFQALTSFYGEKHMMQFQKYTEQKK